MDLEAIKKKYNLSENSYYTKSPYGKSETVEDLEEHNRKFYVPFRDKWRKHTAEGWYGPEGLGYPMPEIWYSALDEFLEEILKEFPDFQIHQIKIKFGGVRIYLAGISEKAREDCREMERVLFDKHLIY